MGKPKKPANIKRSAAMSDEQPVPLYRWSLSRDWQQPILPGPALCCIGLNPSTADAETDDPTINRLISLANQHGYEGIRMVNLYAWRSTDPAEMWAQPMHKRIGVQPTAADPLRRDPCLDAIIAAAEECGGDVLCAWGGFSKANRGQYLESFARAGHVILKLQEHFARPEVPHMLDLYALGFSAPRGILKGQPLHPICRKKVPGLMLWKDAPSGRTLSPPAIRPYKIPWRYLDPGIVNAVRMFDDEGFSPCDSGDGESKNKHGRVFDIPHVVLSCPPEQMQITCKEASEMMQRRGIDMKGIDIRGSYPFTESAGEAYVLVSGDALKSI